jgi:hypothetical protein
MGIPRRRCKMGMPRWGCQDGDARKRMTEWGFQDGDAKEKMKNGDAKMGMPG